MNDIAWQVWSDAESVRSFDQILHLSCIISKGYAVSFTNWLRKKKDDEQGGRTSRGGYVPGRTVTLTWEHEPTLYALARYRRACRYEAYIPDPLSELEFSLSAHVVGVVSEAEAAIRSLNESARPALAPLARLLLKSESIASSKIEGMQLGARELARAEARMETGQRASPTAREVMANIDAMELAVDQAAAVERFTVEEIRSIHRRLMERSANPGIAGQVRTGQNWIGGNDYDPCGADFVPPPPEYVAPLLEDLCEGLTRFRAGETGAWIEHFASAAASTAELASAYLQAVQELGEHWRALVNELAGAPRADAAVWAVIDILPAHPLITAPVAAATTGRSRPAIYQAIEQL